MRVSNVRSVSQSIRPRRLITRESNQSMKPDGSTRNRVASNNRTIIDRSPELRQERHTIKSYGTAPPTIRRKGKMRTNLAGITIEEYWNRNAQIKPPLSLFKSHVTRTGMSVTPTFYHPTSVSVNSHEKLAHILRKYPLAYSVTVFTTL